MNAAKKMAFQNEEALGSVMLGLKQAHEAKGSKLSV